MIPNTILLEGGNLYRAIVYALMESGMDLENLKHNMKNVDIKQMMDKLKISIKIENRDTTIYINNEKIDEEKLQSKDSSLAVSEIGKIANNKNLYIFGHQIIDEFKNNYNIVVSGRDLMKIYPELDYHFLITASLEERVKRKCIQYNGNINEEEVRDNIIKRDRVQEEAGFYTKYTNTVVVDVTNCETVKDSANKVFEYIKIF